VKIVARSRDDDGPNGRVRWRRHAAHRLRYLRMVSVTLAASLAARIWVPTSAAAPPAIAGPTSWAIW
jgi:hypothetical protein